MSSIKFFKPLPSQLDHIYWDQSAKKLHFSKWITYSPKTVEAMESGTKLTHQKHTK